MPLERQQQHEDEGQLSGGRAAAVFDLFAMPLT